MRARCRQNLETNLWRDVTHLWYGGWPAQGVPSDPSTMLTYLLEARSHMKTNSGPHVVHCSPGTGRTGTVIVCDIAIREFEQSRTVDVPKTVYAVRRCRAGAVQTRDQYALVYKVTILGLFPFGPSKYRSYFVPNCKTRQYCFSLSKILFIFSL